jgi:ribosomal protein S18 acetylase RimI-like enzyme
MLEAYAGHPTAFTSRVTERSALPLSEWAERLSATEDAHQRVFGGFRGGELVAAVGLRRMSAQTIRHKATVFGLFVHPQARGLGLAMALMQHLHREASVLGLRALQLTVTEDNSAARAVYEACGYRRYGQEPRAVLIDGRFHTKLHLWLPLDPTDARAPD